MSALEHSRNKKSQQEPVSPAGRNWTTAHADRPVPAHTNYNDT